MAKKKLRVLESMSDALGRSFIPKEIYTFDEDEADGLLAAGFAEEVEVTPEHGQDPIAYAVKTLKEAGAGVVIFTGETQPDVERYVDAYEVRKHTFPGSSA